MEYPAAPSQEQLTTILQQVIQGQNPAELEKYFKRYLKLTQSVQDLMVQLTSNSEAQIRQLASVLLRKKINKHWASLSTDVQQQIKQALVDQLTKETEVLVRKNIASLTATLASEIINSWPEILTFISQCTESDSVPAKEIGLYLLAEIMESDSACEFLKPHHQNLLDLFAKSLEDTSSREIRRNALKALGNHATNSEEESSLHYIVQLIPKILQVVEEALSLNDEELVVFSFEVFDSLIESGISMTPHLEPIVRMAIEKIGANKALALGTRECAMDFLETLAERSPKVMTSESLSYLMQHIFSIACETEEEESSPVDMALRLLDQISLSLPNKAVYPLAMNYINQMKSDPNTLVRKAGLLAIGVIAEGCADYMKQELGAVVEGLLQALEDPQEVIKESASLSLGYCAEHLKPEIYEHHEKVVPKLIQVTQQGSGKVMERVLYALDTFCESFDEDIENHLESLVGTLVEVVVKDFETKVKQVALSALASVITSADKKIMPYFQKIVEVLGNILNSLADMTVKASSLQSLGTLASSSTLEQFNPYIQESSNLAYSYLNTDNLEFREAAFAFFYNLSNLLKENTAPYFDTVFEQALTSCETAEVHVEDDLEDQETQLTLKIRTAFLDEKTAALHTVGSFCKACPQQALPYLERISKVMEYLFEYYHENIRMQCVTTASQITEGISKTGFGNIQQFWFVNVVPHYLDMLTQDDSKEVVCRVLESVEELVKSIKKELLPENYMAQFIQAFKVLLEEDAECQKEGDETEGDHDETLMGDVTDTLHALAKEWGEAMGPYFEEVMPLFARFTHDKRNPRDRNLFTGALADIIQNLPYVAAKYSEDLSNLALRNLQSGEESLYRNSLYFLGVVCEFAPSLAGNYMQYLELLNSFLTSQQEPETVDNAVAAVCRMVYSNPQSLPLDQVLPALFEQLPIKADIGEVQTVLKCVCFLFENGYDMSAYLQKSIKMLVEGVVMSVQDPENFKVEEPVKTRALNVLKGYTNDPHFQEVGSKMTPEAQQILTQLLAN